MFSIKFKNKTTPIILIIILFLVVFHYLGLSRFTNKYLTLAVNPLIKTANHISSSLADFISLYLNREDLQQKNDELQRKIITLAKKNIELELLKQENELLKKELEFLDDYEYQYIVAQVLGHGPNYENSYVLINKGSSSGLKEGLAVTTEQGVIIGKIIKVEDNLAHIKFLIDNQSKLAVQVIGERPALGIAQGQHNLNLKIEMLPKDISIAVGDLVTTPGLEDNIPAGLLIGHVSKVDKEEEKFWQAAMVEPAVAYQDVRLVTIILPAIK